MLWTVVGNKVESQVIHTEILCQKLRSWLTLFFWGGGGGVLTTQTFAIMLLDCGQPLPLLRHTDVPPRVIENFILTGYRFPNYSLRDCLLSAFRPTNETGNFWTHFLPVFVFSYYFVEVFGWGRCTTRWCAILLSIVELLYRSVLSPNC